MRGRGAASLYRPVRHLGRPSAKALAAAASTVVRMRRIEAAATCKDCLDSGYVDDESDEGGLKFCACRGARADAVAEAVELDADDARELNAADRADIEIEDAHEDMSREGM